MIAARFLPYAVSLLLDLAYAIIAVCALSRDTWASPLRTLACLLLCILLMVSTWWQSRLEAPSGAIQRSCVIAAAGSALCVIGSLILSSWAVISADSYGGRVHRCGPRLGAARPTGFTRARQPS